MNFALVLDVASWIFLGAGSLAFLISAFGVLRMPTFYTRLHAVSVLEVFGPGLLILGMALQATDRVDVLLKLASILMFVVLTGPLATHSLAKAAIDNGILPGAHGRKEGGPPSPT